MNTQRLDASVPSPAKRVGVIVPPGNPVVEPELHSLLGPALFPYVARFPTHRQLTLGERLSRYIDDTPCVCSWLRDVPVAATYLACTGSSYPISPQADRDWARAASAVTGSPVATATGAVASVLRAVGAHRLRIVSPYPLWLTQQCVEFWAIAGFHVVGVHGLVADGNGDSAVSGGHPIYSIEGSLVAAAIELAVEAAESIKGRADAVLVAGTGIATVDVLDRLAAVTSVVLVSSNVAGARWLLAATGLDSRVADSEHRALARLPFERGR